jgi:putative hydrolase of the HAD superfamily
MAPARDILVFDLDDTLYAERQFALSGFRAAERWACAELGLPAGLAEEMTRLLDQGHLGRLFGMALAARLPDHRPEHLEALVAAYRDHEPELSLFADAQWALEHFQPLGPLALITDGTASVQARKVAALGIAPFFQQTVLTGSLGGRAFHKPHPQSYQMVEEALASAGDRLIYVGDNPSKDFIVPNARGWVSVMVERPGAQVIHGGATVAVGGAPRHTIASLADLPAVLAR